ncbi:MAG TPA: hypothetical protein PK358_11860 [Spirochaetota bacterium]|nr:hypothetical protein [Spirochaetota bacterium]HPJ35526.1 hypothetical protein [Spirochaetota bacterium]
MSLKKAEIDELVRKLREKYRDYSEKHNRTWFDIEAFDQRLSHAIRSRMNMEGFILAEISNFEKLKERYDKRKKEKENSFSKEVNRIIEENAARIKKYPAILFHPRCDMEISHFYGALSYLTLDLFPVFWLLTADSSLKNMVNNIEEKLGCLAVKRGDREPSRIADHMLMLNRPGVKEIEVEKDRNDYLKEGAFLLHEVVDFCDSLIEMKNDEWNYPIQFRKLYIEEERRKRVFELYRGMTGYGAILKVKEYASSVIEDFRLNAFRKNG